MLGLIQSWLAIGLLVVLAVGGLAAVAGMVFFGIAMLNKAEGVSRAMARAEREGVRWVVLVFGGIAAIICAAGVPFGIWATAHLAVWNNSVPGQAQARSGHWEQRAEPASDWAGQPAYVERVEKARGDGFGSTVEPRIAVRCTAGSGMSVVIAPGDARFGGAVTLAVVADGTADKGQALPASSVSTHRLELAADGTLALADPRSVFELLASAGTATDLWAAPASTARGGQVYRFDTDWSAERLAAYRDCDAALAAAFGGR